MTAMERPVYYIKGVVRDGAEATQDFVGPLDLILHLLQKNRIAVRDIPLAGILAQFLTWMSSRRALDLGFYISFSGIVTFRNAEQLRDAARYVPLDRLLVETDSPYLAPVPHRGKENQPAMVRDVAEYMAVLKGVAVEELAQVTTDNFARLFHIDASRLQSIR